MKKYSILLFLLLIITNVLHGMEQNSNSEPNRTPNISKSFNFEGMRQNSRKVFENLNNRLSTLKDKYLTAFNRFNFKKPTHQAGDTLNNQFPVENMKKIVFGAATDYEEVQVTFKKLVLPWYKKSPFKLAAITGAVGFFTGTIFGWKVKSFFGGKKQKVTEE